MNLVIDASVAAKWFFSELYSEEAQLLLSPKFVLFAPDFILVEVANVIWKKSHRQEIASSESYIDSLAHLSDILVLRPMSELVIRAATLAVQLDHPVYDCMYLTCAWEYGIPFVTADQELSQTATNEIPNIDVWNIRLPEVAHKLSEEG